VRRAQARLPLVRRAILFGSLATGTPTPRSDADILIVVASSPHARAADRLPEMLEAMSPLPCPIDLFVYTTGEFERALREQSPLVREAVAGGLDLV
jgi:predicted nucleotidyltransferase